MALGRWRSALEALRQPSSIAAIAMVLAAYGIDAMGQSLIAGILGFAGVLLASITCLNIMDRGAQPWLGFVFYAGNYAYGYLTAPDDNSALPTGFTGWLIAVLAAAYTIREAHAHWRRWSTVVPFPDPPRRKR